MVGNRWELDQVHQVSRTSVTSGSLCLSTEGEWVLGFQDFFGVHAGRGGNGHLSSAVFSKSRGVELGYHVLNQSAVCLPTMIIDSWMEGGAGWDRAAKMLCWRAALWWVGRFSSDISWWEGQRFCERGQMQRDSLVQWVTVEEEEALGDAKRSSVLGIPSIPGQGVRSSQGQWD